MLLPLQIDEILRKCELVKIRLDFGEAYD